MDVFENFISNGHPCKYLLFFNTYHFEYLCLCSASIQTKGIILSAVIWIQPAAAEAVVDSCQSTVKAQKNAQN